MSHDRYDCCMSWYFLFSLRVQLKVQCLGTKSKLRYLNWGFTISFLRKFFLFFLIPKLESPPFLCSGARAWRDMPPRLEDRSPTPTNDDVDNRSDASNSMFNRGVRSSSENQLGGSYQDEPGNRVRNCWTISFHPFLLVIASKSLVVFLVVRCSDLSLKLPRSTLYLVTYWYKSQYQSAGH